MISFHPRESHNITWCDVNLNGMFSCSQLLNCHSTSTMFYVMQVKRFKVFFELYKFHSRYVFGVIHGKSIYCLPRYARCATNLRRINMKATKCARHWKCSEWRRGSISEAQLKQQRMKEVKMHFKAYREKSQSLSQARAEEVECLKSISVEPEEGRLTIFKSINSRHVQLFEWAKFSTHRCRRRCEWTTSLISLHAKCSSSFVARRFQFQLD